MYNMLLNAEVQMNLEEDIAYGKVKQCALSAERKVTAFQSKRTFSNPNPNG